MRANVHEDETPIVEIHCDLPNAVLWALPEQHVQDDSIPTMREYWKMVGPIVRRD